MLLHKWVTDENLNFKIFVFFLYQLLSMLIVATELHVRNGWKFIPFVRHSIRSTKQAKQAAGCLHVWVGNNGWRIGYTLTAWKDKSSMLQYRNTDSHKVAMQQIGKLSKQYKTLVWEAEQVPSWNEAKERLDAIAFKLLK